MDEQPTTNLPLIVKLCSDKAAYEVRLRKGMHFDLELVRRLLEASQNYDTIVHTPYILALKVRSGPEVTFSEDGRVLVRKISGEEEARTVARKILQLALRASSPQE